MKRFLTESSVFTTRELSSRLAEPYDPSLVSDSKHGPVSLLKSPAGAPRCGSAMRARQETK